MNSQEKARNTIAKAQALRDQIAVIRDLRLTDSWKSLTEHIQASLERIKRSLLTEEMSPYDMGRNQGEYSALERFVASEEGLDKKEESLLKIIKDAERVLEKAEKMNFRSPLPGGKS